MTEQPETVRIATPADVESIYWLLLGDLQADNSLGLPVSPRKVLSVVKKLCSGEGGIAGVIDGSHGRPIASIGIEGSQPWMTEQWMLSQVWLFVATDSRGGERFAGDLFRFAEWHRQDMSAKVGYEMILDNTVLSRSRLAAKERLWSRFGERIGAVFWTRGKPNGQAEQEDGHIDDNA